MRNPCLPKPRQGEVVFSSSETPRVTHVLVTALGRRVEKVLQSYQGGTIHSWHLGWLHPAAQVGIKHPLRNLHDRKSLEFIAHALQNGTAASARLATNQHS